MCEYCEIRRTDGLMAFEMLPFEDVKGRFGGWIDARDCTLQCEAHVFLNDMSEGQGSGHLPISYCPMCGRKLGNGDV